MRKRSGMVLAAGLLLVQSAAWAGPGRTVKTFDSGVIDYAGGFIEATAEGTVDMRKVVHSGQAEIKARRTARHLAYEKLAETVGKIQIDSKTLYQDAMSSIDALKTETHAVIRGAVIQSDELEWQRDRRTQEEYPMATVTLRLHLTGQEGLGHLIDKYLPAGGGHVKSEAPPPVPVAAPPQIVTQVVKVVVEAAQPAAPAAVPAAAPSLAPPPAVSAAPEEPAAAPADDPQSQSPAQSEPPPPVVVVEAPAAAAAPAAPAAAPAYAWLAVDLSGVDPGYQPAYRVFVRDEGGELVYGPSVPKASVARSGGRLVRYAETLDAARAMFDAEGEPLVVPALSLPSSGEVVLAADQAAKVRAAAQAQSFLSDARVVLVFRQGN